MSAQLPSPEDYILNCGPLQAADLVMWIIDERPKDGLSLKGIDRKTHLCTSNTLRPPLSYVPSDFCGSAFLSSLGRLCCSSKARHKMRPYFTGVIAQ